MDERPPELSRLYKYPNFDGVFFQQSLVWSCMEMLS